MFSKKIDYQLSEHTKLYQHHVPNSIAAKLVCIDDRFTKPIKFFFLVGDVLKIFSNGSLKDMKVV